MNNRLRISTAKRAELDIVVDWAATEGWNPGLYDADCYYTADPSGFLLAYLDDFPVASISAVQYGTTFGFLGFYIVKQQYRNQGYGLQIWNAAINRLKHRNIGLDGVLTQQENYKKSGFKLAYRNIRFAGVTHGFDGKDANLVTLDHLAFNTVRNYEQNLFPDDRTALLQAWITQPESTALGYVADGLLTGYGVIRRCRSGYKIGPLFGNTAEIAECLFLCLQSRVKKGESLFLDVPEVNVSALALAEKYGMYSVFETARMYTGDFPNIDIKRVFGVTSFEVG